MALFGLQNPFVPVAFLTGGFFSGLCGFLGMKTTTNASSRTAKGVSLSLNSGLQVAFRSGAVMGLIVVGFGLLDISIWYFILDRVVYTQSHMAHGLSIFGLHVVSAGFDPAQKFIEITTTMLTFGAGASTQALFARVGGGIFTKAADVGADLVGKIEVGIPEDDARNPATIADNVGDNVGDVAGMGADLYESYYNAILATAALGAALPMSAKISGSVAVVAPMIVAGIGSIMSVIGIFMVKCQDCMGVKTLLKAIRRGIWSTGVFVVLVLFLLLLFHVINLEIFGSILSGLVCGTIIGFFTEYYTSDAYFPTKNIAKQAITGPATAIIEGLSVGMFSSGIPVVAVVLGVIAAFGFSGGFTDVLSGLYGISFAAVGMLATLGITLATDAYGPIADNAGGNAQMAALGPEIREKTDALDMLGNTTAATGKGFAIASAALTALALLAGYIMVVDVWNQKLGYSNQSGAIMYKTVSDRILHFIKVYDVHIINPLVICGLFIGSVMPFIFCALAMKAVGRAAGAMVEEVRRQFKELPGIMAGTAKPDYKKCIEISTKGAQKQMIAPALLTLIVPILVGLIFGVAGVMGLLAGAMSTGFVLACTLNNAGGAWDNAKKHIERGNLGGTKLANGAENPVHLATVIADTVGDPFKDTCGPSLNILIKLMSMVSIIFAPAVVKYSPIVQHFLHLSVKY